MFSKGKIRISAILLIFGIMVSAQNVRADEFGERFYNQTPKGMADYTVPQDEDADIAMDEAAQQMQDIMPAAGDEEEEVSNSSSLENSDDSIENSED